MYDNDCEFISGLLISFSNSHFTIFLQDCYLVSVLNDLAGNSFMVFCDTCNNVQRYIHIYSSFIVWQDLQLTVWLVNPRSFQSCMDLPKVVWTSNSVTIKSLCVLKDKFARSEGRELSVILIQIRITDNLTIIYWDLTEEIPKKYFAFFVIMFFVWFSQNWASSNISSVFRNIFRQLHGGYTIKLSSTNCSIHMENIRTLVFLYGPHFIQSVIRNCGPNILPYGPYNWLIRA